MKEFLKISSILIILLVTACSSMQKSYDGEIDYHMIVHADDLHVYPMGSIIAARDGVIQIPENSVGVKNKLNSVQQFLYTWPEKDDHQLTIDDQLEQYLAQIAMVELLDCEQFTKDGLVCSQRVVVPKDQGEITCSFGICRYLSYSQSQSLELSSEHWPEEAQKLLIFQFSPPRSKVIFH